MQKKIHRTQLYFFIYFSIAPLFCFFLDLFMSTIQPDMTTAGQGQYTQNFDYSIINQFVYLSVWTTLVVATWGICNLVNVRNNKMPKWLVGRNAQTFVLSLSIIVFFVYGLSLAGNPNGVVGFDIWYKILKSSIEHFITPILLLVFYFISNNEVVSEKEYAKKYGWYPLIFITFYLLFAVIREVMLVNFDPNYASLKNGLTPKNQFPAFPYDAVDPYLKSPKIWIPAILAIEFGMYGVGNLFNWLGNASRKTLANYIREYDAKKEQRIEL